MFDVSVLRINGIINSPHRASTNKIQYSRIFIHAVAVVAAAAAMTMTSDAMLFQRYCAQAYSMRCVLQEIT